MKGIEREAITETERVIYMKCIALGRGTEKETERRRQREREREIQRQIESAREKEGGERERGIAWARSVALVLTAFSMDADSIIFIGFIASIGGRHVSVVLRSMQPSKPWPLQRSRTRTLFSRAPCEQRGQREPSLTSPQSESLSTDSARLCRPGYLYKNVDVIH